MQKDPSSTKIPFWRDKRIIPILLQAIFAVIVVVALVYLFSNAIRKMEQIGINLGFGFLNTPASFGIGESPIDYSPSDSYAVAFLAGLLNTFKVAFVGIILATILGIIIGVSRLSTNWLARTVAGLYIEIIRNTPVLVQIFIWYFAVFIQFPKSENSLTMFDSIYINNRGFFLPWFQSNDSSLIWVLFILTGLIGAFALWKVRLKQQVLSGQRKFPLYWSVGSFVAVLLAAWVVTGQSAFDLTIPVANKFSFSGGYRVSLEFAAILIGLVVYTAAFIAEIVRAGIQSVSKGQVEAARALGLKAPTILRLVVFPQAIRVIIPPVTSQYLNLTKNSSLAIAVAFPELFSIGSTILNQTGRAIEVMVIILSVYLFFSLVTSLFMNWFNKYTQLVER